MDVRAYFKDKQILSWALYDWANSTFATSIMAAFFPIYFKQFWSHGESSAITSSRLAFATAAASFVVAILAPVLGAIADQVNAKKKFLIFFLTIGVTTTGALTFTSMGQWQIAVLLYAFGTIGFSGSNIFYDALLVFISNEKTVDGVSAFGFSMGYLGGGLLFVLNTLTVLYPTSFGLTDQSQAVQVSFIMVAIWWALFSIPLIPYVPEKKIESKDSILAICKKGFSRLKTTFSQLRNLKVTFLFLVSYWFYIDGVDTIVRLSSNYALNIGISQQTLLVCILLVQFVAFPCTLLYIKIFENKWGTKIGILFGIVCYIVITVSAYFVDSETEFLLLAIGIGSAQGGIQSLSRSFFSKIIPRNAPTEFFGFYNMLGKFAAVFGPMIYGFMRLYTGERQSILSIIVLFVLGGALLLFVDEEKGKAAAKEMEKTIAKKEGAGA